MRTIRIKTCLTEPIPVVINQGKTAFETDFEQTNSLALILRGYSSDFCCLKSPRNFILALCNCDFEVPTEHPSILAISSCS